jgi:hypothetical protein
MKLRFSQIFWGLLLVIVDIRINRLDLVPDFIGYILVAIGCAGLATVSRQFSTASNLSWVLLGFNLLSFLLRGHAFTAFGILNLAVDCAMMWFLLGGVMDLAAAKNRPDMVERASSRRIAYIAVMSVVTLLGLLTQGSRHVVIMVVLLLIFCILPLLVLILHLIHRVKLELCD